MMLRPLSAFVFAACLGLLVLVPMGFAQNPQQWVGRWDVVRSGKRTGADVAGHMRFQADGSFTSTLAFLATTDGKYRILSNRVIELDFPGILFGRNKSEFVYQFQGDSLTLTNTQLSIDLEFKRLDAGK